MKKLVTSDESLDQVLELLKKASPEERDLFAKRLNEVGLGPQTGGLLHSYIPE